MDCEPAPRAVGPLVEPRLRLHCGRAAPRGNARAGRDVARSHHPPAANAGGLKALQNLLQANTTQLAGDPSLLIDGGAVPDLSVENGGHRMPRVRITVVF